MKGNLWVIPTLGPSRLSKDQDSIYNLHGIGVNQNIYITSDEEIKEGDWFIRKNKIHQLRWDDGNGNLYTKNGLKIYKSSSKKIILTTDTDLITDGVQSIDDEFLEWFVNNPSCEEVEVKEMKCTGQCWKFIESDYEDTCLSGCELKGKYKIIIPKEEPCTCKKHDPYCCQVHGMCPTCVKKEEPKQELRKVCKCKRSYINPLSGICSLCWNEKFPDEKDDIKEEDLLKPKETLEEAAERLFKAHSNNTSLAEGHYDYMMDKEDFKEASLEIAKWQAERMYSEEEVLELLRKAHFVEQNIEEWFEQFKKK